MAAEYVYPPRRRSPDYLDRLTEAEAAELIGVAPKTLRNWRYNLSGPEWIDVGRVIYLREDVEDFLESRRRP